MNRTPAILALMFLGLASCQKLPESKVKEDFEEAIRLRFDQWNADGALAGGARASDEKGLPQRGVYHVYRIVSMDIQKGDKESWKAQVEYLQDTYIKFAGKEDYHWDVGHRVRQEFAYVAHEAREGAIADRQILTQRESIATDAK